MKLDCLGVACPLPVIRCKQYIKEFPGNPVEVLVDNEIATQNLSKMAEQMGLQVSVQKHSDSNYSVHIEGNGKQLPQTQTVEYMPCDIDYVVVLAGDKMGEGDPVLGHKLLEGFVYSLTEQDVLPKYVLLYNGGVKLSTQNSKTIEDLKTLLGKGVSVLSCGLCLDFYGLKEQVQVGEITNMYRILEIMRSHRVVRP